MPWEFHGQKSLMGYSLWGHKESDTTKQLTPSLFFFSMALPLHMLWRVSEILHVKG